MLPDIGVEIQLLLEMADWELYNGKYSFPYFLEDDNTLPHFELEDMFTSECQNIQQQHISESNRTNGFVTQSTKGCLFSQSVSATLTESYRPCSYESTET